MPSRLIGTIAVVVLVVAGAGDYASAFDRPILTKISLIKPGTLYKISSKYKIMSSKYKISFKGEVPLPRDNPSLTGGRLTVTANSTSLTCTLAAQAYDGTEGWKGYGSPAGSEGWKYLNKLAPAGGVADDCYRVVIKENVIKVLAKGTGSLVVLSEGLNSDVAMELDVGSDSYCALAAPPHLAEVAGTLLKMKDKSPFKDNGDGTITGGCTGGLMWEKKDEAGGIHDVDNEYSWAGCCDGDCGSYPDYLGMCQPNAAAAAACSAETGGAHGCSECAVGTCDVDPYGYGAITTIWDWLVQVNNEGGSGFAGHGDWRIPSEGGCNTCWTAYSEVCLCDPEELESILLELCPCGTWDGPFMRPCIDPIFGPTASDYYWSGSTSASLPSSAWVVVFSNGAVDYSRKAGSHHVRAIRGGSPSGAFLDTASGLLD